ncbi:transposase [Candidatus Nitrosocosmicus sp. T]
MDRVLGEGAYDSNDTFKYLSENGIIPYIKVRKSFRVRKTAHLFRNLSVIAQRNDFEQWKDSVSYGQRWITETVFSYLKKVCLENMFILSK